MLLLLYMRSLIKVLDGRRGRGWALTVLRHVVGQDGTAIRTEFDCVVSIPDEGRLERRAVVEDRSRGITETGIFSGLTVEGKEQK